MVRIRSSKGDWLELKAGRRRGEEEMWAGWSRSARALGHGEELGCLLSEMVHCHKCYLGFKRLT